MRFHGLDLNLLVALDVLLTERNVSRAADKLSLTQSATSSALARLRDHFGDPLLVQQGRKMTPTPRAEELAQSVREILMQVQNRILTRPEFDPRDASRSFVIAASDYMTVTCLADSVREVAAKAPNIRIEIVEPDDEPWEDLNKGRVDLLIMPDFYAHPEHPKDLLFEDRHVCLVWSHTKAFGQSIGVEEYLAARHAIVRIGYGRVSRFDDWFSEQFGDVRRIDVVAPHFMTLPFLIAGTDRISVTQERLGELFSKFLPVRMFDVPMEAPTVVEVVQWHKLSDNDPALMWVKDVIKNTAIRTSFRPPPRISSI